MNGEQVQTRLWQEMPFLHVQTRLINQDLNAVVRLISNMTCMNAEDMAFYDQCIDHIKKHHPDLLETMLAKLKEQFFQNRKIHLLHAIRSGETTQAINLITTLNITDQCLGEQGTALMHAAEIKHYAVMEYLIQRVPMLTVPSMMAERLCIYAHQ
jgi:hypothetical protein